ncbi:hypothetical protein [Aquibacillus kalidii]|uniref:hypothetical protein n=1 Tax=Aquibacillus kalidii TaxID=2762597 RepID=UPI0016445762|nr:hypothetical protein [Aquibacillus kalidii]
MSRQLQQLLFLITIVLSIYVWTYGMTTLIEMTVQLCKTMYSAGHNFGTYLKDIFF